ncbi:hypothetical protein [Oceaniferula spumae]
MDKDEEYIEDVAASSGTYEMQYKKALTTLKEGDSALGRVAMYRLARLGDKPENPLGFGKAHLWVAQEKLANFDANFIWSFPVESEGGEAAEIPPLDQSEEVITAQRHLQHAIGLNPEIESAYILLAASYTAQGKRNQAVDVLLSAVTSEVAPHPELHVPLANVLAMPGENLALEERAWHLFSTYGQSRSSDVADKVSYVLSALILKKDENAEATLRRLEAQFPTAKKVAKRGEDETGYEQAKALRMAYHYHRAIRQYKEIKDRSSEGFQPVISELQKVLDAKPGNKAAIQALSSMAARVPTLRERVQGIVQKSLTEVESTNVETKADTSLALALSLDRNDPARSTYLERAISEDSKNGEAMLVLAEDLVAKSSPEVRKIEKLVENAMKHVSQDKRARCLKLLGFADVRNKKWKEAIVHLEQAMGGIDDKREIHQWLAEAYEALGQIEIAALHRAKLTQ